MHVIPLLEVGGAQKLLDELVPEQISSGLSISVLVYHRLGSRFERHLEGIGVDIISLDVPNIRSLGVIPKIRKVIKDFDLIHVHLFPALYHVAVANIGIGKPLVYTEHSTHNKRRDVSLFKPVERMVYSQYRVVIAISEETKRNLSEWLGGKEPPRITVINNGINLDVFKSGIAADEDDRHILMVSRFVKAKDQNTLIRSIPLIRDKEIRVVFAGDGPTIDDSRELARNLNVEDRCLFLGERSDVPDLVKKSYIGVQSSHWEGFGLTAVEFMAAGKPIVASDVEGLRQVVENAGLIFRQGDEKELALMIDKLLDSPEFYASVSVRCRQRAEQYNIKNMSDRYMEIYSNITH